MYMLNNVQIFPDRPFTGNGGISFPANWLIYATADDLAAQGITVVADPPPPPPSVTDLIVYANASQWSRATGGYTVAFDKTLTVRFDTSELSMSLMTGKVARLGQPNPPTSFNWQTGGTTFAVITAAQLQQAGSAIADFVQGTFDTLDAVLPLVLNGTYTTTAQIDAAAWPANHQ